MTLTLRRPVSVTVGEAACDTDLTAAVGGQHHAYAERAPGPEGIARIRAMTDRGGVVTVAVDDESGSVAGMGLVDVPAPEFRTRELAAIGVLTAFRHRDIPSAVSAYPARIAHARGIRVVFLEALPDEEEIYRRTGFADMSAKSGSRSAEPARRERAGKGFGYSSPEVPSKELHPELHSGHTPAGSSSASCGASRP